MAEFLKHDLSAGRWRICWTPSVARSLILTVAVKALLSWKKVQLIPGAQMTTFQPSEFKNKRKRSIWKMLQTSTVRLATKISSIFRISKILSGFLSSVRLEPWDFCVSVDRIVTSVQRSCGLCGLAAGPMGQGASLGGEGILIQK